MIEQHALTESERSFNQSILYGRDLDERAIKDEVFRLPMMASRQVVIVREAQAFKKLDEFLEKYLAKPVASTILVLAVKGKKLDKRKKVSKMLTDTAVVLQTARLYEDKVPEWIESYLSQAGYKANKNSIQLLADYLGTEISVITNEISKLMLNIEKTKEITADDIEKYIGISKDYNAFELAKQLGYRDAEKAFRVVNYFNANSKANHIVLTLSNLQLFFMQLLQFNGMKHLPDRDISGRPGWWPDKLKQFRTASNNYSVRQVENVLCLLSEYDLRSKGVGNKDTSNESLLTELVAKILYC
jgi:DNA polymerase-3 subunit delta